LKPRRPPRIEIHIREVLMQRRWLVSLCVSAILWTSVRANAGTVTAPHVRVTFDGLSDDHAKAVAQTLSAAWEAYEADFGLRLPETILCSIDCGPGKPTRLYTDGNDRVFLSAPSPDKLLRPARSGTFVVYGLCHEPGHIAMYRVLKDRDWMTTAAAEGWAHYAGSVVVDRVWEAKGQELWSPDPYEYKADGTARLAEQLTANSPSDVARGAAQWRELESIIGRKGFGKLFTAWQAAMEKEAPAPGAVSERLVEAAAQQWPQKSDALHKWWAQAGPLFIETRPASAFVKASIERSRLENRPVTLGEDDGTSDGKKSIAGGGHARRFVAPGGGEWYLTGVSVFGSRYGPPQPPAGATFDVALCDADMKPIAVWKQPQRLFPRGEAKWVRVEIPPTRVPPGEAGFYVCLQFRPTATQGVFVHFDAGAKDKAERSSLVATPGQAGEPLAAGDWMIRAEVDRTKSADALGTK
jgi:RNA polymerase sigma-70 factor (ECF subfamily)